MTKASGARAMLAACCCAALAGCGLMEPAPSPVAVAAPPPAASPYEREQHARAHALVRQGRLADAALAWEVLTLLRPDDAEYRQHLAATRRRIDEAVAEQLPRAAAAARRGDHDTAARLYLGVLVLRPDDTAAADALRAVERERNRRSFLGQPARLTLLRPGTAAAALMSVEEAGTAGSEVEHAWMLAGQGEVEAAIGLLERRLAAAPTDAAARRLLDELLQRRAALPPPPRSAAVRTAPKAQRPPPPPAAPPAAPAGPAPPP